MTRWVRAGAYALAETLAGLWLTACALDDSSGDATTADATQPTDTAGQQATIDPGCEAYLQCCIAASSKTRDPATAEQTCTEGILDPQNLNNDPAQCDAKLQEMKDLCP